MAQQTQVHYLSVNLFYGSAKISTGKVGLLGAADGVQLFGISQEKVEVYQLIQVHLLILPCCMKFAPLIKNLDNTNAYEV